MLKKKKIYDIVLFIKMITERCPSGQSVEQGTENPRVGGSIPPLGTINVAV